MPGCPGGARHGKLRLHIESALVPHGAQDDRRLVLLAKQFDRQIGVLDVNQPSRADAIAPEAVAIHAHRRLIVRAVRQI